MRETKRSTQELVDYMFSGDSHKIWEASCEIISLIQNHEKIMELAPCLTQMKIKTSNIDLGGLISRNDRFLKKAFEIIEFHMNNKGCPCCLFGEDTNPEHLEQDGYITIEDTVYYDKSNYVDYYLIKCNQCNTMYKVEEREYHFTWWNWVKL